MPDNEPVTVLENNEAEPTRELRVRVSGPVAARFRQFHESLKSSDDLNQLKLGQLDQKDLMSYALCEWLAKAEEIQKQKAQR